jgi:hypothetical protein
VTVQAVEVPGAVCRCCGCEVPYIRAKLVLAYGMCCLDCLPDVVGVHHEPGPAGPATDRRTT